MCLIFVVIFTDTVMIQECVDSLYSTVKTFSYQCHTTDYCRLSHTELNHRILSSPYINCSNNDIARIKRYTVAGGIADKSIEPMLDNTDVFLLNFLGCTSYR